MRILKAPAMGKSTDSPTVVDEPKGKDSEQTELSEIIAALNEFPPEEVRKALLEEMEQMGIEPGRYRRH